MEIMYDDIISYYKDEIDEVLQNKHEFYHTFEIPKKSGGKHRISEPKLKLKRLQEILKTEFFYPRKYLIHKCAHAYIPGILMQDCIEKHAGKKLVVKMDIKNFFGSITDKLVFESMKHTFRMDDDTADTVTQLCTLDGALPQGAVTSPILSNFVCRMLDKRLYSFCSKNGIEYSRYADDLIFSGDFDAKELIGYTSWALREYYNFKLNFDKLRVLHNYQRQVVLGVQVNNECRLTKEKRKELRQMLYYMKKYGVESCMHRMDIDMQQLKGYLNYARSIKDEAVINDIYKMIENQNYQ